jgi:hypothetical protein
MRSDAMTLKLIPIAPSGTRPSPAFVELPSGGEFSIHDFPEYPASERGEALRKCRISRGINIREAARLAGLRASELSGLEFGKFDLSDADWRELDRLLQG